MCQRYGSGGVAPWRCGSGGEVSDHGVEGVRVESGLPEAAHKRRFGHHGGFLTLLRLIATFVFRNKAAFDDLNLETGSVYLFVCFGLEWLL